MSFINRMSFKILYRRFTTQDLHRRFAQLLKRGTGMPATRTIVLCIYIHALCIYICISIFFILYSIPSLCTHFLMCNPFIDVTVNISFFDKIYQFRIFSRECKFFETIRRTAIASMSGAKGKRKFHDNARTRCRFVSDIITKTASLSRSNGFNHEKNRYLANLAVEATVEDDIAPSRGAVKRVISQ